MNVVFDGDTTCAALKTSFDWFIDVMGQTEWHDRRALVDAYMSDIGFPKTSRERSLTDEDSRVAFDQDELAWYLYLVEAFIKESPAYDHAQGARVIPFFFKIGANISTLRTIGGIDERVAQICHRKRNAPDSGIFELLVALAYKKQGWDEVKFIPEAPPEKSPDFYVANDTQEWFVECKRMSKSSDYSRAETQKWLRMWEPFSEYLNTYSHPFLLDIVFHVELRTLPDDFLVKELAQKLRFVVMPSVIIDNHTWRVEVRFVDLERIENYLSHNLVKIASSLFIELIAGEYTPEKGSSFVYLGRPAPGNESYISEISFAAGALRCCDAEQAIKSKARHIKRLVAQATEQLPIMKPGIVHVALESHDGADVEAFRLKRSKEELSDLFTNGQLLGYIYMHVFDPRVFPDKPWDFGETVTWFSGLEVGDEPLKNQQVALVDEKTGT